MIEWVNDDGGRRDAGFKGEARDCVARAVAIAGRLPYREVYEALAEINGKARTRGNTSRRSARNGVFTKTIGFRRYMERLGFQWVPTMKIGQGCRVHLRADELPTGRLVVSLSRHYAAVVDGVLRDTNDCSRDGTRCVYGYWRL